MKSIRLKVSDETYRRLSQEAKAAGYPGISSYILSKCDTLKFDVDAQREAMNLNGQAIQRSLTQEPGKPFAMRDLFTEKEWKAFTKAARIRASVLFNNVVEEGDLKATILRGEQPTPNHQLYVRTENL